VPGAKRLVRRAGGKVKTVFSVTVILAGVLCIPASVARAQSREQTQLLIEIRNSQDQAQQLRAEVAALNELLKTVMARLDKQATDALNDKASTQQLIKELNNNVTTLGEKVSQNSRDVARFSNELTANRDGLGMLQKEIGDLKAKVDKLNAALVIPDPAAAGTLGTNPTGGGTGSTLPPSPIAYWQQAMNYYTVGNQWDYAVAAFEEYLAKFPNSPDAAKAQLYIGFSQSNAGNYKAALAAFTALTDNPKYKGTEEARQAYFYQGSMQEMLGQRAAAIKTYEFIRKEYPNTQEEIQATQKLRQMGVVIK
jgi:TolA-binding protein